MDDKISEIAKRLIAFTHPASFGIYAGRLVLRRDIWLMWYAESHISIDLAAMRGDLFTVWSRPK